MPASAPGRRPIRIAAIAAIGVVALIAAVATPDARAAKRSLQLSLMDPVFSSNDATTRATWLDRARAIGTDSIRLVADWRDIATSQPANPADPDDPAYAWSALDRYVRSAAAHGLGIMISINAAPDWAEGTNRPGSARPGAWRPSPSKLRQFGTALASRYSGSYVDPAGGGALPRVRDYQVWVEPNGVNWLAPQFAGGKPVSPDHYREMLTAAYKGIHAVDGSNRVIAAGTVPFGDYSSPLLRVPPLRFWRQVLCLRGKKLKKAKCPGPKAKLDVLAHNPLSRFSAKIGQGGDGPWKKGSALGGPDDIAVADMNKLQRLLRKARKHRTISPRRGTGLWATELFWDSNPPAGNGVPLSKQATWLADALYVLWRQRVSNVFWVRIVDGGSRESGLYFADGREKPALTAYRFPFVPLRAKGKTKVWGRAPIPGEVEIQRAAGSGWEPVKTLRTRRSNVFTGKVGTGRRVELRAAIGDQASLPRRPR